MAITALIKAENPNSSGTSFYGHTVRATKNELIELFGQPEENFDDKTYFEWELELAEPWTMVRKPITVYDYKEYRRLGEDELYSWHIGGLEEYDTEQAVQVIENMLEELNNNK